MRQYVKDFEGFLNEGFLTDVANKAARAVFKPKGLLTNVINKVFGKPNFNSDILKLKALLESILDEEIGDDIKLGLENGDVTEEELDIVRAMLFVINTTGTFPHYKFVLDELSKRAEANTPEAPILKSHIEDVLGRKEKKDMEEYDRVFAKGIDNAIHTSNRERGLEK